MHTWRMKTKMLLGAAASIERTCLIVYQFSLFSAQLAELIV